MTFLLDTNVVSEWVKPRPNPGIMKWLAGVDEDRVFLSVITLAELRNGITRLPAGRRREQLDSWLSHDLLERFEGRLLSIGTAIADQWGRITAIAKTSGRTIHAMDAFLAATAAVHELTIVTRDVKDFEQIKLSVLSPWSDD
jgi:predicted nucleic acid-binding protein